MLPKKNRLRKKKDFETVFKKGRGFKEGFLVLKTAPNNLKTSRLAFIVSQKVSKKAVVRNKVKRRLRELAKNILPAIKKGADIALIASPGLENKNFWEIKEDFNKIFEKAKLIS